MLYIGCNTKTIPTYLVINELNKKYEEFENSPYSYAQDGGYLASTNESLFAISRAIEEISVYDRISIKKFWDVYDSLHSSRVYLTFKIK